MEYERKTRLTLEQLMSVDYEAEWKKLRPEGWADAMRASAAKNAARAKAILRSTPCNSERRRYLRHVMEEGAVVIEQFKRKGRYSQLAN